ncbi:MAG TPA: hypothetical protein VK956_11220 [Verrucomicrobium sp.]|nr:hypothetical protein [Verrucomicrobium sp.]
MNVSTPSESSSPVVPVRGLKKWVGAAGVIAALMLVGGRLALEPLREIPHFDDRSMDAYSAVERFGLREGDPTSEIAFFGSSQTVWGIIPKVVAAGVGEEPAHIHNLGLPSGTPFDMWNLVRRNSQRFEKLRLAVVEVNPTMLSQNREEDPRLKFSMSQHATLAQRLMIKHRPARMEMVAEWGVPLLSIRQNLRSVFLNVLQPEPGNPIYSFVDQRRFPAADWHCGVEGQLRARHLVPPDVAARRMIGKGVWRLSELQNDAMHRLLAWLEERKIPVFIHQFPLHPEVVRVIAEEPDVARCDKQYSSYVESLRPHAASMHRILDPAECGATAEGMADRMHLNEIGAGFYSMYLAEKIQPFALPDPGKREG